MCCVLSDWSYHRIIYFYNNKQSERVKKFIAIILPIKHDLLPRKRRSKNCDGIFSNFSKKDFLMGSIDTQDNNNIHKLLVGLVCILMYSRADKKIFPMAPIIPKRIQSTAATLPFKLCDDGGIWGHAMSKHLTKAIVQDGWLDNLLTWKNHKNRNMD